MGVKHKTDFPETRQYFRKSSLALVLEPSVLGGEPFCCVQFVAMVLFFSVKSLLFVVLVIAASSERETRSGLLKEPWASHDQERGSRILFNTASTWWKQPGRGSKCASTWEKHLGRLPAALLVWSLDGLPFVVWVACQSLVLAVASSWWSWSQCSSNMA